MKRVVSTQADQDNNTLADVIRVPARFHRSVNLSLDWRNSESIRDYVVTPSAYQLATRIVREINTPAGSRAWTITGPFGSGKSAFAGFLLDILARPEPIHQRAQDIRHAVGLQTATWHPVVITGRRAPLTSLIRERLAESIASVNSRLADRLRGQGALSAPSFDLLSVVQEVVAARHESTGEHTALVLDELGKLLEYAALHPTDGDIFVLQELAEYAARSAGQFVVLTIQHADFASYARSRGFATANEWQKIQGRFEDVAFHLPIEQMLQLINVGLDRQWPARIAEIYATHAQLTLESPVFAPVRSRIADFDRLITGCLPIHPVTTLLLWPAFRSKLAQNERSLFAFLTSHEPHGFQEFLASVTLNSFQKQETPPLFGPDRLYDYIASALGAGVSLGDHAHQWAVAEDALYRLPSDAPELATPLIKTIFLLSLYSAQTGIPASAATLLEVLGGQNEQHRQAVNAAIEYLKQGSFVTYRHHRESFALWEGSDLDLDRAYRNALVQIEGESLGSLLRQVTELPPRIARGHYLRTGYLRYFDMLLAEGTPAELPIKIASEASRSHADGIIVFALALTDERSAGESSLVAAVSSTSGAGLATADSSGVKPKRPLIVAIPKLMPGILDAIRNVLAWRHVRDFEPALASDHVARTEVTARLTDAEDNLKQLIGSVFGLDGYPLDPSQSTWFVAGEQLEFANLRQFQEKLSALCDETYSQAPPFFNELINRQQLSASAAKARRDLLEAMLHHSDKPRLGIRGAPPESAMYDGLLAASGLHRERDGVYGFGEPFEDWRAIWSFITEFLQTNTHRRCPVIELRQQLAQPPFGLRTGPFPVLLTAFLLAHQNDVALYEQGTFVPELTIQLLERLQRRPEEFALRWLNFGANTDLVPQAVGASTGAQTDRSTLIDVARTLVVSVAQLTPFARQTRRFVSPEAARVRQALLKATDPHELIFEQLPQIFDIDLSGQTGRLQIYADRLRQSILQLQSCYDAMVDELHQAIVAAFGLSGKDPAHELRERARAIQHLGTERRSSLFIREAARETSNWLEGLARTILDGIPPAQWNDRDVATFHARIQSISQEFQLLEELVQDHDTHDGRPILRVDILNGSHTKLRLPLVTTPAMEDAVNALVERISSAVAGDPAGTQGLSPALTRQARIGALAQALAWEIHEAASGDASPEDHNMPKELH